jgi:hypothetical protein
VDCPGAQRAAGPIIRACLYTWAMGRTMAMAVGRGQARRARRVAWQVLAGSGTAALGNGYGKADLHSAVVVS